jgi:hypothetical protein
VRVVKAADALRPGGALATVTTHHVAGGDQSFFAEVQDCYVRWDPETPTAGGPPGAAADVPSSGEELDVWNGRQPVRYSPTFDQRH